MEILGLWKILLCASQCCAQAIPPHRAQQRGTWGPRAFGRVERGQFLSPPRPYGLGYFSTAAARLSEFLVFLGILGFEPAFLIEARPTLARKGRSRTWGTLRFLSSQRRTAEDGCAARVTRSRCFSWNLKFFASPNPTGYSMNSGDGIAAHLVISAAWRKIEGAFQR